MPDLRTIAQTDPTRAPAVNPPPPPATEPITPRRVDGFLPLEQYATLGDGRSVALVGADGSVDWWCVPCLDSPPLFASLLDAGPGGRFAVTPVGPYTVSRTYRDGSNVLETIFATPTGSARLVESLNSGPAGRLPWAEFARRIEGITGHVRFTVAVEPGSWPGVPPSRREVHPNGVILRRDGLVILYCQGPGVEIERSDDAGITARHETAPGSRTLVALLVVDDQPLIAASVADIDARIDQSDDEWRVWARALTYRGPYADAVTRSALALKFLISARSGSIAAAATSSLPERIGGPKNYDYRFAWVRDAAYTTKAFVRVGALVEAQAAFSWLLGVIHRHGPELQVMYTLGGDLAPAEGRMPVPGYRGSNPVRVGNRARSQRQLGIYGDILETAALFADQGHILDGRTRKILADVADRCAGEWRLVDSGIWELEEPRHYTLSKISCWVALNRAVLLAENGHLDGEADHVERWRRERDKVRDWIDEHCWSDAQQSYTLAAGTEDLDASLLLATRFRFERLDRLDLTRQAIQRTLCRGPLVYRTTLTKDEEGAFLACSFWLVEALSFTGHVAEARRTMDDLLRITSQNLGLLNEMIDPDTHAMLGNVPQGLSHLALIHAAMSIDEAERGDG